jgi:ABC-type nickel/cobalt efflux system permease component RcnA
VIRSTALREGCRDRYPWLGLVSGLTAFALEASLLVARLGSWSGRRVGPEHHANAVGAAGHEHVHLVPAPAEVLSRRSLTALAVAGGLLPSPTALIVLLAAVAARALGRVDRVSWVSC